MPLLVYTSADFPFVPFTKIFSADINQCYNDIKTLLNTTKLDMSNIQSQVLTRTGTSAALVPGTANAVVINDSNGNLTDEAQLATSRGGLGFNCTPSGISDASKVPSVNSTGTGFQLAAVPATPGGNVFNYYNFS
jgi:hypothetical protein